MTVEEIFTKLINHMIEGTEIHNNMVKAYDFLGLYGYTRCQLYHYFEKEKAYHNLLHYYHTHYFKLLQLENSPKHEVIPAIWFKYTSQDVDINTKRTAIKDLMQKWIKWEEDTKKLYQDMYLELTNIGEVAAASKLKEYIIDVSEELSNAKKALIKLESINYDMPTIASWQSNLHDKYKKAIKKIF